MASEKVIHITSQNFDSEIATYKGVVLVDFWAEWCGPCRMMGPVIDELANDYEGKAKISKLNVDEEHNIAIKFGITSIPTLRIFKDGNPIDKIIGAVPKSVLSNAIDKALK